MYSNCNVYTMCSKEVKFKINHYFFQSINNYNQPLLIILQSFLLMKLL